MLGQGGFKLLNPFLTSALTGRDGHSREITAALPREGNRRVGQRGSRASRCRCVANRWSFETTGAYSHAHGATSTNQLDKTRFVIVTGHCVEANRSPSSPAQSPEIPPLVVELP